MALNRKAFELAISTLILIILGIFVLIGIIYAVTNGFETFKSSTDPFLDTTQSSAVKQACSLACQSQDKLTYCCREYKIGETNITCTDDRLEVSCELNCQNYNCLPQNDNLLDCSRLGDIKECPPGYICNEEISGGNSPNGLITSESVGGDKKCHKECITDNDCPTETPNCRRISRMTGDYVESFNLCFA